MPKLFEKSLLLRVGLAMASIIALGFIGMVSSVFIAETSEGQAAAINQAGTLRMQSYRIASEMANHEVRQNGLEVTHDLVNGFSTRLYSPRLTGVLAKTSDQRVHSAYYQVKLQWRTEINPLLDKYLSLFSEDIASPDSDAKVRELRQEYLSRVDGFVANIDAMVKVLEEEAEEKIELLRLIQVVSLFLTILLVFITMYLLNTNVLAPLRELLGAARAVRQGDFRKQIQYRGEDELGQLAYAFNLMAEDLDKMYQGLEQRVREKTSDLERSNRSLELLYKTSRQLSEAPISDAVYEGLLRDIEELAGTGRGSICLGESGDSQAFKLATTRPPVFDRPDICNPPNCQGCFEGNHSHFVEVQRSESELLRVFSTPIKDMERQYGVLLLEVPHDKPLQEWQRRLLETVASHIAIAINMAQRASQARMLALLEERSVIARELHDSLAQSLSYLKIQVSRLDAALTQPDNGDKIKQVASELRDGLNSAYRQLRELLTTFRLRMDEAGLNAALEKTVDEFRERGKVDIELDNHLGGCKLGPNTEIHVIQVVREALSNVVRHAQAEHAVVSARCDVNGNVSIAVDDDGVGMPDDTERQHHYGLAIMQERAHGVEGELELMRSALGGTRVELTFSATRKSEALDGVIGRVKGEQSE